MPSSWWWWIGEAVLLGVVIPVVVILANRVIRPAREIRRYASDIAEHAEGLLRELEPLREAGTLKPFFAKSREATERYAKALTGRT